MESYTTKELEVNILNPLAEEWDDIKRGHLEVLDKAYPELTDEEKKKRLEVLIEELELFTEADETHWAINSQIARLFCNRLMALRRRMERAK